MVNRIKTLQKSINPVAGLSVLVLDGFKFKFKKLV
jgi:hypothetical protein